MRKRFLSGFTDDGTVCHRVGERNTEFDDVGSVVEQGFDGAFAVLHIGEAHGEIGGKDFFAVRFRGGEEFLYAVHDQAPFFEAL